MPLCMGVKFNQCPIHNIDVIARVRVYFKRWQLRASELANKRAEAKISAPLVYNRENLVT